MFISNQTHWPLYKTFTTNTTGFIFGEQSISSSTMYWWNQLSKRLIVRPYLHATMNWPLSYRNFYLNRWAYRLTWWWQRHLTDGHSCKVERKSFQWKTDMNLVSGCGFGHAILRNEWQAKAVDSTNQIKRMFSISKFSQIISVPTGLPNHICFLNCSKIWFGFVALFVL